MKSWAVVLLSTYVFNYSAIIEIKYFAQIFMHSLQVFYY